MFHELTREMNEQEKAVLDELICNTEPLVTLLGTLKLFAVSITSLIVCGLLAAGLVWLQVNAFIVGMLGGFIGVVAILSLYVAILSWTSYFHWSHFERQFRRYEVPLIKRDRASGRVNVKKISAVAVVEIAELEDEGGGYVFDLADGRLLFIKGQSYFPAREDMLWPNSDFEIVRVTQSDRWIGVFCYGSELVPTRAIETVDCREEVIFAECEEIVEAGLDEFVSSLLVK